MEDPEYWNEIKASLVALVVLILIVAINTWLLCVPETQYDIFGDGERYLLFEAHRG